VKEKNEKDEELEERKKQEKGGGADRISGMWRDTLLILLHADAVAVLFYRNS
jgi:hypothetical protein